jgi:hypothetical protein
LSENGPVEVRSTKRPRTTIGSVGKGSPLLAAINCSAARSGLGNRLVDRGQRWRGKAYDGRIVETFTTSTRSDHVRGPNSKAGKLARRR